MRTQWVEVGGTWRLFPDLIPDQARDGSRYARGIWPLVPGAHFVCINIAATLDVSKLARWLMKSACGICGEDATLTDRYLL